MDRHFATALGRALEQTRASNPAEATRIIQTALAGRRDPDAVARPPRQAARATGRAIEDAEVLEDRPGPRQAPPQPRGTRGRRPFGEVVDLLARGRPAMPSVDLPGGRGAPGPSIPAGARYERRSFSCAAGARGYRLYVPAALPDGARGLVLMLHGCTQDADDFARGTRMNDLAERHGLVVAYAEQGRAENPQGCWNWFRPGDQVRGGGEPEILAGLAQALAAKFDVPPGRVFAAGLSAGGAMAAILGVTHPEVFAAVGVHSGLPHGSARDVVSAFAAMRGEAAAPPRARRPVRTIVFHGAADTTVHPSNAETVIASAGAAADPVRQTGRVPGGRAWSRSVAAGADGAALTELWLVEGAGHAWSGGAPDGSYTDPRGPDASAEMVRFFLATPGWGAK